MKFTIILACLFQIYSVFGASDQPTTLYDYIKFRTQTIKTYDFLTVDRSEVTFRLWTRDQTVAYVPIYYGNLTQATSIRKNNIFKIITHGYIDSADSTWMNTMKNEFLKKGDYNVIQVDWNVPAKALYPISAAYTKSVGTYVGELLADLHQTLGIPYQNIHMLGHSLGAHISGFACKYIQTDAESNVARITGFDPAGPLFLFATDANRLSRDDATYVDIVHTDGLKYGYILPLGDIDFYPNSGIAPQPGCIFYDATTDILGCSHIRSLLLYIESINSDAFIASECDNGIAYLLGYCAKHRKAVMGENVNQAIKGIFYLTTNAQTPYARNGQI